MNYRGLYYHDKNKSNLIKLTYKITWLTITTIKIISKSVKLPHGITWSVITTMKTKLKLGISEHEITWFITTTTKQLKEKKD